MDLKKLLAGGVAVVVALLVFLLWPSTKVSPEEQVRALIAECVTAAEKHDVGTFMEHLSQDFRGPSGASRDEVKSILVSQLFRNSNETVVFNPQLSVTVTDPSHATFSGVFVFARGKEANWQAPGDGVSRYDIDGTVEKRAEGWQIVSAVWNRPL